MLDKYDKIVRKLDKPPVRLFEKLCIRNRNKSSSCRLCVAACPVDAVQIERIPDKGLGPVVDFGLCTACGACATVCPDGVFELVDLPDQKILSYLELLTQQTSNVTFSCTFGREEREEAEAAEQPKGRKQKKKRAETERPGVQVTCLARINEAIIVGAAGLGAETIWLDTSLCEQCSLGSVRPLIEKTARTSKRFLTTYGSKAQVVAAVEPPAVATGKPLPKNFPTVESFDQVDRRDFLKRLRKEAIKTGAVVVESSIPDFFPEPEETSQGLEYRVPTKRVLLLDAVRRFNDGVKEKASVRGMPFNSVAINENCTGCEWCALFCPSRALLKRDEEEEESTARIDFTISYCTGCDTCRDVCMEEAIDYRKDYSPAVFREETAESLAEFTIFACSECEEPFISMDPSAEYCYICAKKQANIGEMFHSFRDKSGKKY